MGRTAAHLPRTRHITRRLLSGCYPDGHGDTCLMTPRLTDTFVRRMKWRPRQDFEPATRCLEGSRSSPLSYGDVFVAQFMHE